MSDGTPPGVKFTFLDYVALGFILPGAEELLRRPKMGWAIYVPGLVLGLVALAFRDRSPQFVSWFRALTRLLSALKENTELKRQLAERTLETTRVLQENSKLLERFDAPKGSGALPLLKLVKPQHNVQCVGFKVISDDDLPLSTAALCFQNVPTSGKLMGKFECPRLRVIYYSNSTGQEIADMCPLQWTGSENGPNEITAEGSYAEIATFLTLSDVWRLFEVNGSPGDFDDWHKLHHIEIPAGEYRIIAMLSGSYDLHIPPVTGVLTLEKDGTASFQRANN